MERLNIDEAIVHVKEVARESKNHATYTFPSLKTYYDECEKSAEEHEQLAKWLEELKHYKDLEEQGRLIELPCAVGDTVWSLDLDIHWIEYFKVTYITVTEHGIGIENPYFGYGFDVKDLGDTVFLTKEEAEAKLKEIRGAE